MKLNLTRLVSNKALAKITLIHSSEEDLPLVSLVLKRLTENSAPTLIKHTFIADRYFDYKQIANIVTAGDLFATNNYIEVSHSTKPNAEQQQQIIELNNLMDDHSRLVIIIDKLSATELNAVWVKKISEIADIVGVNPDDAKNIVVSELSRASLTINSAALEMLLAKNSANASQLLQEVSRLCLAEDANSTIDPESISHNDNSQYTVYQLSSAYLNSNILDSIKIVDNLLTTPDSIILILWMLHEDVKKLIKLKSMLKAGSDQNEAIRSLRVWGNAVGDIAAANRRLNYSQLLKIMDEIAELDMIIKGVNSGDTELKLKQIIQLFN